MSAPRKAAVSPHGQETRTTSWRSMSALRPESAAALGAADVALGAGAGASDTVPLADGVAGCFAAAGAGAAAVLAAAALSAAGFSAEAEAPASASISAI